MPLLVSLHGRAVGRISVESGNPVYRFLSSYQEDASRRVLGRWFEDRTERMRPEHAHIGLQGGLPNFFAHYLPPAGSPLRRHLARRAGVPEHREYSLLRELGSDLPGAITVRDDEAETNGADVETRDPPVSAMRPLRFSLAGIQLKFSLLQEGSHLVLPLTGEGGRWIGKFPDLGADGRFEDVTANEFAMMRWAEASGIDVPTFGLRGIEEIDGLPEELSLSGDVFVTRRFDRRDDGGRVHQEDLAQVLDVPADQDGKYGVGNRGANYTTVGNLIARLCGREDFEEYLRRLTFMVLSANHDAHLKNWSFVYSDGLRPRLSPAYDLVCTLLYADHPDPTKRLDTDLALSLSRTRDPYEVTRSHLVRIAEKTGQDPVRAAVVVEESAARIREAWEALRRELSLSSSHVSRINGHLMRVQL